MTKCLVSGFSLRVSTAIFVSALILSFPFNLAPSARQKAFDLIKNIIGSFNDGLDDLDWMAKHDRKAAAEKVSTSPLLTFDRCLR